MAGLQELHSFVGKFVNLWKNGFEASLHVDSKAGKATVNLQVGLGEALPVRTSGPSRIRRRQRRADARRTAEEASAEEATAEEAKIANVAAVEASTNGDGVEPTIPAEEAGKVSNEVHIKVPEKVTRPGKVTEATAEEATVTIHVIDEICSNEMYKTSPTPSPSAASAPPSTTRRPGGFDYWTLTYDDISD